MSLTAFGSNAITAAILKANFDDKTATISTQAVAGQVDHVELHRATAFSGVGTAPADFKDFTAPDDMELRVLRVTATDGTAGRTVTATLSQTEGDTAFLLDQTISVSVTTVVGTAHGNLDMRTATSTKRIKLLRGVRYRLKLAASAGPVTTAQVSLVLRTRRRRR